MHRDTHPHGLPRSIGARVLVLALLLLATPAVTSAQPQDVDLGPLIGSAAECAGDVDTLRDQWWAMLSEDPDSAASFALLQRWRRSVALAIGEGPSPAEWRALSEVTSNGWNRRLMLGIASDLSRATDEIWSYEDLGLTIGTARRWIAIGPFGRSIEAELHQERPALFDFDFDRAEEGLHGPVEWRPLPTQGDETGISPRRVSWRRGGAYLSRARVDLPLAVPEAYAVVSTSGSARVLLGDATLVTIDRRRSHLPRTIRIPISLERGTHLLRLIGDRGPITIRFTNATGHALPLRDLDPAEDGPTASWSFRDGPPPANLPDLAAEPRSVADLAARIGLAIDLGDTLTVDRLLPAEPVEGEGAGALAIAAERALSWLPWLPSEVTRSRLDRFRAAALATDPNHVPASLARIRTLASEDQIGAAMRALDTLIEVAPRSLAVWLTRESIAEAEGWRRERETALDALASIAPRHPRVIRVLRGAAEEKGRRDEVFALDQRLFEVDPNFATGEDLAQQYVERADLGAVARLTTRLARISPDSPRLLSLRTRFAKRFGEAKIYEESILPLRVVRSPDDPGPWEDLADLWIDAGDRSRAIGALRRAHELDPGSSSRARRIAHLEAGSPLPGEGPTENWRSEAVSFETVMAQAPPVGTYPGANAVLLMDQMVSIVTATGGTTEMVHQVVRLESQEAVDAYSEFPTPGEIVELAVHTPDGRVLQPTGGFSGGGYTLPGLAPGAIIEARTVRHGDLAREDELDLGPFFFQDPDFSVAFHRSEWIVHLPADWEPEVIVRGGAAQPEESRIGDVRRLAWRVDRSERAEPEDFMPPADRLLPNARIRVPLEWSEVLPDLAANAIRDDRPTPTLRAAASEILTGVSGTRAKVRALYDAVCDRLTRGGSSSSATSAWISEDGDRTLLLAGLLRAAGIEFHRVYAAAAPHRTPWADWSSPRESDFALALLEIEDDNGTPFWVQVPSRMARMGRIPREIQGGRAIRLDHSGGTWFTMPTGDPTDDSQAIIADVSVAGSPPVPSLEGALEIRALGGSGVKEQVKDQPPFVRSQWVRQFIQQALPGSTVNNARFENFDVRDEPLRLAFELEAPTLIQVRDGVPSLGTIILPSNLKGLLRTSERTHPIFGQFDNTTYERLTIDLGDYEALSIPDDLDLEGPWGRFRATVEEVDGKLVLERLLDLRPFLCSADQWDEFTEFCERVDRREEARISLGVATP